MNVNHVYIVFEILHVNKIWKENNTKAIYNYNIVREFSE